MLFDAVGLCDRVSVLGERAAADGGDAGLLPHQEVRAPVVWWRKQTYKTNSTQHTLLTECFPPNSYKTHTMIIKLINQAYNYVTHNRICVL